MLNARAYSLRQKSRLAISLSWIAGYTNVVSLIHCGVMTSHVTGNVTHFGQHLSELSDHPERALVPAGYCLFLIFSFLSGAIASGIMMQTAQRNRVRSQYITPIAVEALLLLLFSIGMTFQPSGSMSVAAVYVLTGIACCAMGLQNATITQVSGSVVRTTHLTGVVTDLGTDVVALIIWLRKKTRGRGKERWRRVIRSIHRHSTAQRGAILISIAGSFLFGVVAGAVVYRFFPLAGLIPPVLFLLLIVWIDYYQPIADLILLDPVSSPELAEHGIDQLMLPPELSIFRIGPHLAGAEHQAPNFSAWADDLSDACRVAILSLGHAVRIDAEAAFDLQAAVRKLKASNCHLIMAGLRPEHYDVLDYHGVTRDLSIADLCPDIEFAVARAIDVLKRK